MSSWWSSGAWNVIVGGWVDFWHSRAWEYQTPESTDKRACSTARAVKIAAHPGPAQSQDTNVERYTAQNSQIY